MKSWIKYFQAIQSKYANYDRLVDYSLRSLHAYKFIRKVKLAVSPVFHVRPPCQLLFFSSRNKKITLPLKLQATYKNIRTVNVSWKHYFRQVAACSANRFSYILSVKIPTTILSFTLHICIQCMEKPNSNSFLTIFY